MRITAFQELMERVRQTRLTVTAGQRSPGDTSNANAIRFEALEARVAYLEQLLEGLQDSVHRESERHGKLIAEVQAQIQPGTLGAALAQDARQRGL